MVEGEEKIQIKQNPFEEDKSRNRKSTQPTHLGKIEGCREDRCGGISAAWTLRVVIGGYFLVYRENSGKYRKYKMCLEKHTIRSYRIVQVVIRDTLSLVHRGRIQETQYVFKETHNRVILNTPGGHRKRYSYSWVWGPWPGWLKEGKSEHNSQCWESRYTNIGLKMCPGIRESGDL